jgi:hypothetical protein
MLKWSAIIIIFGIKWLWKGNSVERKPDIKTEIFKSEKHPKDKTN